MSSATDDFPKLMHGNYHAWAPRMTAELQRLGVWRFCTGDESIPMEKLTAMPLPTDASTVPFQSIWQGLWCVTGLPKFWFQWPSKVVMTYPNFWEIFGSLAPHATRNFLYYSHDYQMNSAHHKNRCDNCDISAFWRVPWRVTAELNEMVQYFRKAYSREKSCRCYMELQWHMPP